MDASSALKSGFLDCTIFSRNPDLNAPAPLVDLLLNSTLVGRFLICRIAYVAWMDCTYLSIHPSFETEYGICVHFVALSIFITFITTKRIDTLE
jgi:hypothetical protein